MSMTLTRAGTPGLWLPSSESGLTIWLLAGPTWCFSDLAGTVPCAIGDTVMFWKDISGRGINFTQSAAKSTDRTLQRVSGKYYVSFGGGANDYMSNAGSNAALNNAAGSCVGLADRPGTQSQSLFTTLSLGDSTSNGTFTLIRGDGTALPNTRRSVAVGGHATNTSATDPSAYIPGSNARILGRCDPTTLKTLRLIENGVQVASTARTVAMPTTTGALSIGTDTGNLGRLFIGWVFGLVVYNRDLADIKAGLLDTYLRSLMP